MTKEKAEKIDKTDKVDKKAQKEAEDKIGRLTSVLREINKDNPGAISFASEIKTKDRIPFGIKALDTLTNGGILCGNFSTIWGSKGCGKSTAAYKLIASAQKAGKIAAYLDIERAYDATWAKKMGVDTEALVYVACETAEAVLDIIIKLAREKAVDLIVLDSIQGMSPKGELFEGKAQKERSVADDSMALLARKLSQFFRMSIPYVAEAKIAVLLIGQARMDLGSFIKMETLSGGHALLHNSRLILRIRRGQGSEAPTDKIKDDEGKNVTIKVGFDTVIHVDKSQTDGCTEGTSIHVPFYFSNGFEE